MNLRGIGGSPTAGLLVLIDGHPQYMGLMGHPIADAYQTMLTDQVEVLRPCLGAVWFQRHGWRYQYRNPQDAGRRG